MKFQKEFNRIMQEQTAIALATSINNSPNVRIVNFYYDPLKKVLFFSSFKENRKIKEFSQNKRVSFTTVPVQNNEHVRVSDADVHESEFSVFDFKKEFADKIPDYELIIDHAGDQLILFEIHIKKASVTLDIDKSEVITLL